MVWAFVYGGLVAVTVPLLAVPTARVVREVRVLNRAISAAGRRIGLAVTGLVDAHDQR